MYTQNSKPLKTIGEHGDLICRNYIVLYLDFHNLSFSKVVCSGKTLRH